jgi:transposase
MDFHLDSLLNLPNVTVFTSSQKLGFILLKLEFLNEGINCPHCQYYTDILHQTRPILVRDLSSCGQGVYLQVPRRQFYCPHCKKSPTERLDFLEMRRNYTIRYEEYIYETSTSLKMGFRRMKKWLTYAHIILGKTADTLEAHLPEICHYFINRTTSGVMEGINTRIKLIIRQSYGLKSFDSLREKLLACLFDYQSY